MQDGLLFDDVEKHFGGTYALKGVSLKINRGEIVALLGENGAGKSTLIKVLGGIHAADAGGVFVDGKPYRHVAGNSGTRQAVAFIHQDLGLIEWMSVAENIAMAIGYPRRGRRIDWAATERQAEEALKTVGADFAPTARVASLSRTEKSLVAIARALAVECDFLVLDEPTASLPADEVEKLFAALRPLKAKGVGMIYVSHRLDEIFRISDRVAVLRDGKMVGLRETALTDPAELVTLIVGRKARAFERPAVGSGTQVLSLRDFATDVAGPIDLSVECGEVVGLVGLRGAGHEDIGRALYGLARHSGDVRLDGAAVDLSSPRAAMAAGIGLVARDRVVESIAPGLSIRENAFLNPVATGRPMLKLRTPRAEEREALELGRRVGLSPNDPTLAIEALSGGNQQKVVFARWLGSDRRFLIAEDPTAGVDVGAKAEIYNLLFEALGSGMGVLVVSTDFEEVANICHRAVVFSRGRVVDELSGTQLSTEALIAAASASERAA